MSSALACYLGDILAILVKTEYRIPGIKYEIGVIIDSYVLYVTHQNVIGSFKRYYALGCKMRIRILVPFRGINLSGPLGIAVGAGDGK